MRNALLLLVSFVLALSKAQTAPTVDNQVCQSTKIVGGSSVELTPEFYFHWLVSEGTLTVALEYEGDGWVGLGLSPTGAMIGSRAVVGSPDWKEPRVYDLNGKNLNQFAQVPNDQFNLTHGHDLQMGDKTTLSFQIGFPPEKVDLKADPEGYYTFVFAGGAANNLNYHAHRGAFRINLTSCTYYNKDHKAAFLAHGIFATLAFAVVIPFAVGAARFRVLVPKNWIYVHVICNCFAFFFTIMAVAAAITGMVMRGKSGMVDKHMSNPHHWIGLVIFIFVIFQVINGFRRPPVETKVEAASNFAEPKPTCCGLPMPQTGREKWNLLHRLTAIIILALTLYQLPSGLKLYAIEYLEGSRTGVIVFGVWVGLLVVAFIMLSLTVRRREHKKNRASARNIMPQREEDDDEGPQAETKEFTNII